MKYKNPETGERRVLGVRGRNKEAERLEAEGWVRVSGTDVTELREMQAREAEFRRQQLERERIEKQPPIVPVLIQPVPAAAGPEETAGEDDDDAEFHDDGAVEDEGDAG